MNLTDSMAAWIEANGDRLRAVASVSFRRFEGDRPKHSAQLLLSRDDLVAEILVWESGEVELSHGSEADGYEDEHHEIDDPAELRVLLESMLARMRA